MLPASYPDPYVTSKRIHKKKWACKGIFKVSQSELWASSWLYWAMTVGQPPALTILYTYNRHTAQHKSYASCLHGTKRKCKWRNFSSISNWALAGLLSGLSCQCFDHWATTTGQPPASSIFYILHRWYWILQLQYVPVGTRDKVKPACFHSLVVKCYVHLSVCVCVCVWWDGVGKEGWVQEHQLGINLPTCMCILSINLSPWYPLP